MEETTAEPKAIEDKEEQKMGKGKGRKFSKTKKQMGNVLKRATPFKYYPANSAEARAYQFRGQKFGAASEVRHIDPKDYRSS